MRYKRNYYCLVAGLSDIILDGKKPKEASLDFKDELNQQLDKADYQLVEQIFLTIDNENLLNLLLKNNAEFVKGGKYSAEELEQEIKEPVSLPGYLKQFILDFQAEDKTDKTPVERENQLLQLYYQHVLAVDNDFLKKWFLFELNIKNVLSAVNCDVYEYNKEKHLIKVDQNTELYTNLLKSKVRLDYLVDQLPFADKILGIAESNKEMQDKEKQIDELKWQFLNENTFFHYFTIEKVLSFIIKLNITERWLKLDEEEGKQVFEKILTELTEDN